MYFPKIKVYFTKLQLISEFWRYKKHSSSCKGERYIVLLVLIPRLSPSVLLPRMARLYAKLGKHGFAFLTATGRMFFNLLKNSLIYCHFCLKLRATHLLQKLFVTKLPFFINYCSPHLFANALFKMQPLQLQKSPFCTKVKTTIDKFVRNAHLKNKKAFLRA